MGILIVSHLLAERERLDRMYELRDGRRCSDERALAAAGGSSSASTCARR